MKRTHAYMPATLHALTVLGTQIAVRRRELRWTAAELADRLGVSPPVVARIEGGAPGTAVATVLEAAVICGIPLFGIDPADRDALALLAGREKSQLALLPARTRRASAQADDDF